MLPLKHTHTHIHIHVCIIHILSQKWWNMPTIPEIRIQRQEDHDFKMNLAYISDFKVSLRYVGRPYLKKRGVFGEGRMAGDVVQWQSVCLAYIKP